MIEYIRCYIYIHIYSSTNLLIYKKIKCDITRQRVDPVLAPDQFSVARNEDQRIWIDV